MRGRRAVLALFLLLVVNTAFVSLSSGIVVKWSLETSLTNDQVFDAYPSVLQSKDGKIWVAWQSNRILNPEMSWKIFYKTFDGAVWSSDRLLPMSDTWLNGQYHKWQWHDLTPSLLETGDGRIWVFWSSNRTENYDVFFMFSSDGGTTWSIETQLTTHSNDDNAPAVFQTATGAIWVVWQRYRGSANNYDIFFKTSSDNGSTWSNESQLTTDSAPDKLPSIAQTRDGRIWVVWQSYRNSEFDIFYKTSSNNGVTWSSDSRLTTENDEDTDPFILVTTAGRIWVVYCSRQPVSNSQDELYYKISEDGSVWSDRVQLTKDGSDDMYPAMAQGQDRKIWVVWASDRLFQPEIFYKTSLVLKGDANEDGTVDVNDLALVSGAYGSRKGDYSFDKAADLNNDDVIDLWDLTLVAKDYGKTL